MRYWLMLVLCGLALTACGFKPAAQDFTVTGESMEPTFHMGQIVSVAPIDSTLLHRGDVVLVALSEKNTFLKRVIGLPGDTISIRDGQVYVNAAVQNEPYLRGVSTACDESMPCTDVHVPDGAVFVLGDNRMNSSDSRSFGSVPFAQIKGQVQ